MNLELIKSVNPVVPSKGSNAGKSMFVINGQHWSKNEPQRSDTHVCLETVEGEGEHEGKEFVNVIGFSQDSRMSITDKIKVVTDNDASYSMAIATLLK